MPQPKEERMKISRLFLAAACAALVAFPQLPAFSQTWPTKPVRLVVPFSPGGTTDLQARLLGKKFAETFGQAFVVENRPGASGLIGTEIVARGPSDGYNVLLMSAALSVNATLYAAKAKFDPVRDLIPVTWLSSVPLVLIVHPSVPATSVKELVALSKRTKGGLNGANNGAGTTSFIALEMLKQMAGADAVSISYKGGGPAALAILAGEVDLAFATLTTVKQHVDSGRLRPLAVTTRKPSGAFPKLPTMASIYPDFESDNWFGVFVAAKTAPEIVSRLHAAVVDALKAPEISGVILREGGDVVGAPGDALAKHVQAEIVRYAKVIKTAGIRVE